ncbi:hypothetical protein DL771_004053 [Monosporascus sp. 5C6A]|nr:hypothetical protein DL771_004053 [Monosporascus sp. 5C6A]
MGHLRLPIPDEEIPVLAGLLGKMWKYDPSERASTADLLEYNWFKNTDIPDAAFSDRLKQEDFVNWPLPEDTSVLWTLDGAAEQDVQQARKGGDMRKQWRPRSPAELPGAAYPGEVRRVRPPAMSPNNVDNANGVKETPRAHGEDERGEETGGPGKKKCG